MKKILAVILILCMALFLAACNTDKDELPGGTPGGSGDSHVSNNNGGADHEGTGSSNILVAYFSCTSNTKNVAVRIAEAVGADIYEITPETPYTDADLDNNNPNSRSTQEQDDVNCRPAISGSVSNMNQYDTVIIGYPIWWGRAPKIMNTFLESYDFSGKKIVPFCTSANSGIALSVIDLQRSSETADWEEGGRIAAWADDEELDEWLTEFNLK